MITDSVERPDSGDSLWSPRLRMPSLLIFSSEISIIPLPSIDEPCLLVLEACVELTAQRELSSWVFLLKIFGRLVDRKRDRMEGIDAVMITKNASMKSQRS